MRHVFLETVVQLRRDDRGVTLVEYGIALLLALMVSVPLIASLAMQINANIGEAETKMQDR